jgi:hypothetical protein
MINPYTFYCIGFVVALLLYALGWSDAYPKITTWLAVFILITLLVHFALARYWSKFKKPKFHSVSVALSPLVVTLFIYGLWTIDFIYEGGIPLLKILLNKPFNYRLFGMPSLHVFAVTLASFYTHYLFHVYLSSKQRIILVLYFINLFAAVLICSRSMLFFNLTGSFFLYLFSLKTIPYRKLLLLLPVGILMFYLFGVVGNKRVSFESKGSYSDSTFLETGRASRGFRESVIPKEFFWSYIYISSPLANLQANIRYKKTDPITVSRILQFINNEFLFESFSKRVNALAGVERESEVVIKDPFNVSTVYSRSYSYLGWTGIILMALFVLVFPLLYQKLLSENNPYSLSGYAILCTMYLFLVYDNTFRLMALGFLLVYPILFPFVENKLLKRFA